jgi:hypothetical protein
MKIANRIMRKLFLDRLFIANNRQAANTVPPKRTMNGGASQMSYTLLAEGV